jgi:uncharacterized membrane protein YraQ (UPF0718 family)
MLKYIWQSYLSMAPFLVFGFFLAGVLHVLIKREVILKHLGEQNALSVLKAGLIGVPLPLCSCSVIPTAVALRKQGASPAAVMAFLISTPMTGLDSILATYGIMGLFIALYRAVIALLMGLFGGIFALFLPHGKIEIENIETEECGCSTQESNCNDSCGCSSMEEQKERHWFSRILLYGFDELLGDIARPLLIGIFLSGLLAWLIPEDLFTQFELPKIFQMGLMVLIGIPLYICATSSLPLAAVLMLKGLSPGVVFVFLAAGPATNAATMTTISSTFGKKFFTLYLASIIAGAISAGLLLDYLIVRWGISIPINSLAHNERGQWIALASAILLAAALIRVHWKQVKKK